MPKQYAHAAADPSRSDLHGKARPATNINVEHMKIGKSSNVETSNAPTKEDTNTMSACSSRSVPERYSRKSKTSNKY